MAFRIKICGITRPEDAIAAIDAGADAIGLNFFSRSRRYVEPAVGQAIRAVLPLNRPCVGVFVNADPDWIQSIRCQIPLDVVQFHGDESPEILRQLAPIRYLRAIRCQAPPGGSPPQSPDALLPILQEAQRWLPVNSADHLAVAGNNCEGLLLDAHLPGHYGGTGVPLDWDYLAIHRDQLRSARLVLAGGLTPENVADAIRRVRPDAVDTASGVESAPGIKCPARLAAFVREALRGFREIGRD